jgi:transposase
MKTVTIGVDISKDWLDYSCCPVTSKVADDSVRVDNTIQGIESLIKDVAARFKDHQIWFCFEHTGSYGLLLSSLLQNNNLTFTAVSAMQIKKSQGVVRGKSDAVDARRIASYAAVHFHELKPSEMPSEALLRIKSLLAYRQQLTKIKSQLINSMKAYDVQGKVFDVKFIQQDVRQKIDQLQADIQNLDKQIEQIIGQDQDLDDNFKLVKSVKGIGPVIAAYLMVHSNNFTAFDDPRKFNCFVGIAPFEHSSGKQIGRAKTPNYKHRQLKTLLFNGASSAAMYDPQIKKYYQRKKKEGKHNLSVLNAIACKLIYRAFATVKRRTPYVIFAQ